MPGAPDHLLARLGNLPVCNKCDFLVPQESGQLGGQRRALTREKSDAGDTTEPGLAGKLVAGWVFPGKPVLPTCPHLQAASGARLSISVRINSPSFAHRARLELSKLGQGWANRSCWPGLQGHCCGRAVPETPRPAGCPCSITEPAQQPSSSALRVLLLPVGFLHWDDARMVPAALVGKGTQRCLPRHPGGCVYHHSRILGVFQGFLLCQPLPTASCVLPSPCAYIYIFIYLCVHAAGIPSEHKQTELSGSVHTGGSASCPSVHPQLGQELGGTGAGALPVC